MPDDGIHFTNAALTEAFARVAATIATSSAITEHARQVALDALERVRVTLGPQLPPDQTVKPLPDVPTGWQG